MTGKLDFAKKKKQEQQALPELPCSAVGKFLNRAEQAEDPIDRHLMARLRTNTCLRIRANKTSVSVCRLFCTESKTEEWNTSIRFFHEAAHACRENLFFSSTIKYDNVSSYECYVTAAKIYIRDI